MKREKNKHRQPLQPVPMNYRSDLCAECVFGCDEPFRPSECPYDFFQEHVEEDGESD